MARIFIAIEIPDNCRGLIRERLDAWRLCQADIRWVKPDNLHFTLKFLGEVTEDQIEIICLASRNIAASHKVFSVSLAGTGVFPCPRNPKVLWIGAMGDLDMFCSLQNALDLMLEKAGFKRETRPFSPHLTTGRVRSRRKIAVFLNEYLKEKIESAPFTVKELAVYKSEITGHGPLYHLLARYPLGYAANHKKVIS
ncbi:MAG: RNA 2',3'-cyclic phosphodiesterase [Dissulfurimicrobium sp.]|uniref:RNA 2',3'-cyclic phosphodiesterase n=1 Tax=Dissulfurimicrobium sp. TaxID=2022436 RepID=UPI004049C247